MPPSGSGKSPPRAAVETMVSCLVFGVVAVDTISPGARGSPAPFFLVSGTQGIPHDFSITFKRLGLQQTRNQTSCLLRCGACGPGRGPHLGVGVRPRRTGGDEMFRVVALSNRGRGEEIQGNTG